VIYCAATLVQNGGRSEWGTGREPDLDESDNSFKVTLYPKKKAVVGEVEEGILNLLRTSGKPMKTREISAAIGLAKRTTINWINRLK
jgi:hypothetical protein